MLTIKLISMVLTIVLARRPKRQKEADLVLGPPRSEFIGNGFVSPEESFKITVDCGSIFPYECNQARKSINIVTMMIVQAILVRVPICARITFKPCEQEITTLTNVSSPVIAQRINGSSIGPTLAYPEFLSKQSSWEGVPTDVTLIIRSYMPEDISMRFNSVQSWNFDYHSPTQKRKHDFSFVFARELTKAMGFKSGLKLDITERGDQLRVPRAMHLPVVGQDSGLYMNPITPFDSLTFGIKDPKRTRKCFNDVFCFSNEDSVLNVSKGFNKYLLRPLFGAESTAPNGDTDFYRAGLLLDSIYESPGLELRLRDGQTIRLDNRIPGISKEFKETEDFLMVADGTAYQSINLKENIIKHGMQTIYGPKTLAVLEEIGWPTRRTPIQLELRRDKVASEFFQKWNISMQPL